LAKEQMGEISSIDVRGEICPYPMMKTNEELDKNQEYVSILDVLTDHPPALSTIPPQALKRGFDVDIEEVSAGEWRIRLTKIN
tara:strand:- start:665 stop:913 length:249 start_codon:yes stop_codon:yes gene_type:complete